MREHGGTRERRSADGDSSFILDDDGAHLVTHFRMSDRVRVWAHMTRSWRQAITPSIPGEIYSQFLLAQVSED
jgi:hypothetical protein